MKTRVSQVSNMWILLRAATLLRAASASFLFLPRYCPANFSVTQRKIQAAGSSLLFDDFKAKMIYPKRCIPVCYGVEEEGGEPVCEGLGFRV